MEGGGEGGGEGGREGYLYERVPALVPRVAIAALLPPLKQFQGRLPWWPIIPEFLREDPAPTGSPFPSFPT
jgi:hypothetical protein